MSKYSKAAKKLMAENVYTVPQPAELEDRINKLESRVDYLERIIKRDVEPDLR
mgnify:FL=1